MEQESARNGKEYMITMSTMIWVNLTRNLNWRAKFLGDRVISLTREGEEPAEKKLKQVRLQTLVTYFGLKIFFWLIKLFTQLMILKILVLFQKHIFIIYVNRS